MQTMEKASEGEENSRAKSYPAENKALKNCQKNKGNQDGKNITAHLH